MDSSPKSQPTVHVAIPVQDEVDYLPDCVAALQRQVGVRLMAWFCVNQPEAWQHQPERQDVCAANQRCLELLSKIDGLDIKILDRSSPGWGWPDKRGGVGHARKTLMDAIVSIARDDDLIVSLDADTIAPVEYLRSVVAAFDRDPTACGLAARYFHPVTDDDAVTRAMLGYEIYMRYYVLNLWRIGSPYAFTALGSAIALPVRVYRQLGGLTPRTSGEDFYFLQKLTKHGRLLQWSDPAVEPATRKSWRVPVGTGQAIVSACEGTHEDRYPLYAAELFDRIAQTTGLFAALFAGPSVTPLDAFLVSKTGSADPWQALRENCRTREQFVRACHERLDGLRILQYVKAEYRDAPSDDSATLRDWLTQHGCKIAGHEKLCARWTSVLQSRSLVQLSTPQLDELRRMLSNMEDQYRREHDRVG